MLPLHFSNEKKIYRLFGCVLYVRVFKCVTIDSAYGCFLLLKLIVYHIVMANYIVCIFASFHADAFVCSVHTEREREKKSVKL